MKVATTKDQRKLFFKVRSSKMASGSFKQKEVCKLAEDLKVERSAVVEMESRMMSHDSSFDAPLGPDQLDKSKSFAPADTLFAAEDDPSNIAEKLSCDSIAYSLPHQGMMALDERSRDVINACWLYTDSDSISSIKSKYDLSTDRIRKIENSAKRELRVKLSAI